MSRKRGMGSHQSADMKRDEWLTPPAILAALGPFDLDPCSPIDRPWPTASQHFTVTDDGLTRPWRGFVWCNPPYGRETGLWMAKLAAHGSGLALIFARTETEDFVREVWGKADGVMFLHGRLYFHVNEDTLVERKGKPSKLIRRGEAADANSGAPSCLVAYGQAAVARLEQSGLSGTIVKGWRGEGIFA
ncbi:DNA N-6-adenine-methyltransferase [Aminobacter sp. BE322]|uniref:DNA N-6-adenine-methyltransferase n=1 Tax=unclassified Aminobacter TaxID=2644704 RepID=UPI003D249835